MLRNKQNAFVIKHLMKDRGMPTEEAIRVWMNSKTRAYLEENNLFWVAETRCYWELVLELNNDRRWLKEPFDM